MSAHSSPTKRQRLLGGVCSALAARLGWSVWGLRGVVIVLLIWRPVFTIAIYLGFSLWLHWLNNRQRPQDPQLTSWDRRLDDIDRRYRDFLKSTGTKQSR